MRKGVTTITKKQYKIFEFLADWRVANYVQLALLSGAKEAQYTNVRLNKLSKEGYLISENVFFNQRKVFALTKKGQFAVDRASQFPYAIKPGTLEHELAIVDIVLYFHLEENYQLDDLYNESKMRQLVEKKEWDLTHFPDIATSDKKIAIEFEKTQKSKERLEENVMQNFKNFDMQIWYIPKNSKSLFEALKELKEKHLLNMHILFIEDLQKQLYRNITFQGRSVIREK